MPHSPVEQRCCIKEKLCCDIENIFLKYVKKYVCFIFFCQFFEHVIPYTQKSYTIFLVQKGIYFLALKAIVSMAVLALGCSKPLRCLKNVWFWGRRAKHVKNIFQFNKICKCVCFSPFFFKFFPYVI